MLFESAERGLPSTPTCMWLTAPRSPLPWVSTRSSPSAPSQNGAQRTLQKTAAGLSIMKRARGRQQDGTRTWNPVSPNCHGSHVRTYKKATRVRMGRSCQQWTCRLHLPRKQQAWREEHPSIRKSVYAGKDPPSHGGAPIQIGGIDE